MSIKEIFREYLRPWKILTLLAGLGLLISGANYYRYSDWDIGVSLLMGFLTYFTAPWSVWVLWKRKYVLWPLAIFFWYFTVDGCYWIYHTYFGHELIREENLYTSTPLYFIMGCIWLYRGSLRDFVNNLRRIAGK